MIALLQEGTAIQLIEQGNASLRIIVSEMSTGLTIQKALEAPKMFQVQKRLGVESLIKILCVVLKSFCDSIKASKTLDAVDIFECAELIAETYTHDSVKDVIMALKLAKKKGRTFYNSISQVVILEIIAEYMDGKAGFIEKREADRQSELGGSVRTELGTLSAAHERRQEEQEKREANKQVNQIKAEKREIQKLADFIDKNIDKVK